MSYSQDLMSTNMCCTLHMHTCTHTFKCLSIDLFFFFSFLIRTLISSGHDPNLMESQMWIRSIQRAHISCCWGTCNDTYITFGYRCSSRQECVIVFHGHFSYNQDDILYVTSDSFLYLGRGHEVMCFLLLCFPWHLGILWLDQEDTLQNYSEFLPCTFCHWAPGLCCLRMDKRICVKNRERWVHFLMC